MSASEQGINSAAPKPCTARASDEHRDVRGQPAAHRGHGKDREADQKDPPPPEPIGGGATQQQQGGNAEGVGVEDPLHRRQSRVERRLDAGQGDIHHRLIDV